MLERNHKNNKFGMPTKFQSLKIITVAAILALFPNESKAKIIELNDDVLRKMEEVYTSKSQPVKPEPKKVEIKKEEPKKVEIKKEEPKKIEKLKPELVNPEPKKEVSIKLEPKNPITETLDLQGKTGTLNLKYVWNDLATRLPGIGEIASLESVFGAGQQNLILTKYNGISDASWSNVKNQEKISFPLIYPNLRGFFTDDLSVFLSQNKSFSRNISPNDSVIIVTKYNGKFVLGHYKNGNLNIATQVSLGKDFATIGKSGKKRSATPTPQGVFYTGVKEKYDSSSLYDITRLGKDGKTVHTGLQYPMPYSIQVRGAIKFHVGKVNGYGRSHGCIRTPLAYIIELYKEGSTKVVIDW